MSLPQSPAHPMAQCWLLSLLLPVRPATLSQGNVAAAFYHVGIHTSLGRFFALERVRAGAVGLQEIDGQPVDSSAPLLTVLPMRWSWSVFFMRATLRVARRRASLEDGDAIEGRRAPHPMAKKKACNVRGQLPLFQVDRLFPGSGEGHAQVGERATLLGSAHASR